jgi:hypothetical protein
MAKEDSNYFWPSFLDLFINLFFVMLLLFVTTFVVLNRQKTKFKADAEKLKKINEVQAACTELLNDSTYFQYDSIYKRFRIRQEIEFVKGKSTINSTEVLNFETTNISLQQTGLAVKRLLDKLIIKRQNIDDTLFRNVTYLVIITGSASAEGDFDANYELSYRRAFGLYKFWKTSGVVIDSTSYKSFIDLQIAGVGTGGIGRNTEDDNKNRSFYIQIIPKISAL